MNHKQMCQAFSCTTVLSTCSWSYQVLVDQIRATQRKSSAQEQKERRRKYTRDLLGSEPKRFLHPRQGINSLAFFTIKWPMFTPSNLTRELSIQSFTSTNQYPTQKNLTNHSPSHQNNPNVKQNRGRNRGRAESLFHQAFSFSSTVLANYL